MLNIFYTDKQVNDDTSMGISVSKSPLKPRLVMDALLNGKYKNEIKIHNDFNPLTKEDIMIAHTEQYVNDFLNGVKPICESNSIPWSKKLAESVTYTNASLYNAIKYAVNNPNSLSFSPTSGFHHAQPHRGKGFCTFSGQVISSVKIYRETNKVGAYCDLDGHYGNSIGDARMFCPDVIKAISMNINPIGINDDYVNSFKHQLAKLETSIIYGETDYVVFCHGADSHEHDDFAYTEKVNTENWLYCSHLFYGMIKDLREKGWNVPVVMCLFGGYRKDNYQFVIDLHIQDIEIAINTLKVL